MRLAMTMALGLLKIGRLEKAATYSSCAEFVQSCFTSGDGVPEVDILDAA
jgi:hypothetical protein